MTDQDEPAEPDQDQDEDDGAVPPDSPARGVLDDDLPDPPEPSEPG